MSAHAPERTAGATPANAWTLVPRALLPGHPAAVGREDAEHKDAIKRTRDVIEVSTASLEALKHLQQAIGCLFSGDNAGTIAHCRAAIALDPDFAAAFNSMGHAFANNGQPDSTRVHVPRRTPAVLLRPRPRMHCDRGHADVLRHARHLDGVDAGLVPATADLDGEGHVQALEGAPQRAEDAGRGRDARRSRASRSPAARRGRRRWAGAGTRRR